MSCQNLIEDTIRPCGDEGDLCEKCAAAEEAYWGSMYRAGLLDPPEQQEQDLKDAGRGHLLPPE